MNNEKSKSSNTVAVSEEVKHLIEIKEKLKERLDIRTSPYLRKSNKYFMDYDKDWSLVWFINKFITTLKWDENKIDNLMLIKLYEETKDELFVEILEYRIISKKINGLKVNKKIKDNTSEVNSNSQKDNSGKVIISDDEIEEIYL